MESVVKSDPSLIADVKAVLGEGPLWDPDLERLLFLDIKGEKIFRTNLADSETEEIECPGMVSSLGLTETPGAYVCTNKNGFATLSLDGGIADLSPIIDPEEHLPGNRFNDGKIDPYGYYIAGTMENAETFKTPGSWWQLKPDSGVLRLATDFLICNGPTYSVDGKMIFLTDSARQTVFRARLAEGGIEELAPYLQFEEKDGYPDGMEVDREGCLWIAFWDGNCVRRFDADGKLLEEVVLPVPRPTSLTIVDDAMFVTSASIGLSDEEGQKYPGSGGLYRIDLTRSLGRPSYRFALVS
ncbi:MAG: SMP-30/gluconolactonase/LRE family protein [Pseudomonadota bacterium]